MRKNVLCFLILMLYIGIGLSEADDKGNLTAEAPTFKVGDTWVYDESETKAIEVTGDRVVFHRKITSDRPSASLCGVGKPVREMRGEYDRNYTLVKALTISAQPIKECDDAVGLKYYDFPLFVGKTWSFTADMKTDHRGQTDVHLDNYVNNFTVESIENVTVPAGTFRCFKIRQAQQRRGCNLRTSSSRSSGNFYDRYSWYSPEAKRSVKTTNWDGSISSQLSSMKLE